MKFKELIELHINKYSQHMITESTKKFYYSNIVTISKYFDITFDGGATVESLTSENIRSYQRWRDDQLSKTTKEKEMRMFKIMLKVADKEGLIEKDCSDEIYKYKSEPSIKSQTYIDPERLMEVFQKAKKYLTPEKFAAFYIGHALMTRPAELLNLEKKDFDLQEKKVYIRGTKNTSSNSILPISVELIDLIAPLLAKKGDDDRLFPYSYMWLVKIYQYLSEFCDVFDKSITPHKARKNMVMYHLHKGTNIKVLEKLGRWSNSKVLLDIYAKATPGQLKQAAAILG